MAFIADTLGAMSRIVNRKSGLPRAADT